MGRGQWSRKNLVGMGHQKLKGNIQVIFSPFVAHRKDLRQNFSVVFFPKTPTVLFSFILFKFI